MPPRNTTNYINNVLNNNKINKKCTRERLPASIQISHVEGIFGTIIQKRENAELLL